MNDAHSQAGGFSVCVLGLGYIGLPTAATIAWAGHIVTGVDVNLDVVNAINAGRPHIQEAKLDELLGAALSAGRLRATSAPVEADVYVVAVPTPVTEARSADLSYVMAAGRSIAPVLTPGATVILESTSPVGTTEQLAMLISELRPDLNVAGISDASEQAAVYVAYCPERIIPGNMVNELTSNDRIIGGLTEDCAKVAAQFYRSFVKGRCFESTARVAEMVKLTENAFRDVNIAFANELSMICEGLDVDVWEVIRYANKHPRVSILNPGAGVGGHCIAVDPWFIVEQAKGRANLIETARRTNDSKPVYIVERTAEVASSMDDPQIACFGLSYKADVDDFRESPALAIAGELTARFPGRVTCVDPFSYALDAIQRSRLNVCDANTALSRANIIVMLVPHSDFTHITWPAGSKFVDAAGFFAGRRR